jgi:hypothetical protein
LEVAAKPDESLSLSLSLSQVWWPDACHRKACGRSNPTPFSTATRHCCRGRRRSTSRNFCVLGSLAILVSSCPTKRFPHAHEVIFLRHSWLFRHSSSFPLSGCALLHILAASPNLTLPSICIAPASTATPSGMVQVLYRKRATAACATRDLLLMRTPDTTLRLLVRSNFGLKPVIREEPGWHIRSAPASAVDGGLHERIPLRWPAPSMVVSVHTHYDEP